jgi:hypothetical protein
MACRIHQSVVLHAPRNQFYLVAIRALQQSDHGLAVLHNACLTHHLVTKPTGMFANARSVISPEELGELELYVFGKNCYYRHQVDQMN